MLGMMGWLLVLVDFRIVKCRAPRTMELTQGIESTMGNQHEVKTKQNSELKKNNFLILADSKNMRREKVSIYIMWWFDFYISMHLTYLLVFVGKRLVT